MFIEFLTISYFPSRDPFQIHPTKFISIHIGRLIIKMTLGWGQNTDFQNLELLKFRILNPQKSKYRISNPENQNPEYLINIFKYLSRYLYNWNLANGVCILFIEVPWSSLGVAFLCSTSGARAKGTILSPILLYLKKSVEYIKIHWLKSLARPNLFLWFGFILLLLWLGALPHSVFYLRDFGIRAILISLWFRSTTVKNWYFKFWRNYYKRFCWKNAPNGTESYLRLIGASILNLDFFIISKSTLDTPNGYFIKITLFYFYSTD